MAPVKGEVSAAMRMRPPAPPPRAAGTQGVAAVASVTPSTAGAGVASAGRAALAASGASVRGVALSDQGDGRTRADGRVVSDGQDHEAFAARLGQHAAGGEGEIV